MKKEIALKSSRKGEKLDSIAVVKKYIDTFMSTLADLQIIYTFVSNDKSK